MKLKTAVFAVVAFAFALCVAPAAFADTYNFDATGTGYVVTGTITGTAEAGNPNAIDLTSANLFINGVANTLQGPSGTSTTSNVVTDPFSGDQYQINNVFYITPPVVDYSGIAFKDALGNITNIFDNPNPSEGDPAYQLMNTSNYNQNAIGVQLTFSDTSPVNQASPVPEPGSLALLGTGILGVVGAARRRFVN